MAVDLQNTKFSDIDLAFVKQYLRVDFDEDDIELQLFIEAAKDVVLDNSQMTIDELDSAKRANVIYLKLINDFYSNRGATSADKLDPIYEMLFKNLRNYTNVFGTPETVTTTEEPIV